MTSLTDKTIRAAKPGVNPETGNPCGDYKLFDGGGLFLLVTPKGGKYWRYKYRLAGKEKKASLGTYPETSLAEAREKHGVMRKQVERGDDPVLEVTKEKAEKEAVRAARMPFREVAQEWYDAMIPASASASTKDRAQRAIKTFSAAFGSKAITEVAVADLATVLAKHEKAGKFATRERDQLTAIKIMGYCVGRGYLKANPFREVKFTQAFTAPGTVHNPRPAIVEPAPFGQLLRDVDGDEENRALFRLLTLTAVRPGELVKAEWSNVDLHERKLIIPAALLKQRTQRKTTKDKRAGKDLEVPLSRQAVEELKAQYEVTGTGTHLFPARRANRARKHPQVQVAAINNALVRLGYAGVHCGHGFRSSFSTMRARCRGRP